MGTYASSGDVTRRIPYPTLSTTTKPSTTDVDQWITEAEAAVTGALASGQVATPVTNADGIQIIKSWVCDYCEGRVRTARAASGGDGGNTDGKDLIDRFWGLLTDIRNNPAMYDAMLAGGSAGDSTRRMRGYVLDNVDGKTISAGDFAPAFTRSKTLL